VADRYGVFKSDVPKLTLRNGKT